MARKTSVSLLLALGAVAATLWPATADAQWRRSRVVVVGSYYYSPFYDPFFFGPGWYPYQYPYYYPAFAPPESDIRVLATPKEAEVYVDGYYAGIVDDFNGVFQRLHVPPGDHEITLHLDGYRTVTQKLYLAVNSTYKLRYTMEKLAPGEASEPPPAAQTPPPPSPQTEAPPPPRRMGPPPGMPPAPPMGRMPPPAPPQTQPASREQASNSGALVVRTQPPGTEIRIDGERWSGPQGDERLVVQLSEGTHHVEIQKDGYRRYSADVQVRRGETTPLNVSLSPEK